MTLAIEAMSMVNGYVRDPIGQPVSGATVTVYNRDKTGMVEGLSAVSDETGFYGIFGVMPGDLTVTAFAPGSSTGGLTTTSVDPANSTLVDVFLEDGAAVFDYMLEASSTQYSLSCAGAAAGGPDGQTAFSASTLRLARPNGIALGDFPCLPFANLSENSRQPLLDAGYVDGIGLDLARKIFVPADGTFARYLEVLTNRGPSDVTVRVRIVGALSNSSPALVAPPDDSDNTFAAFNEGNAVLGLVFGGFGAPVTALPKFTNGRPDYGYEWTVTIPAGETRRLMHFVVQGLSGAAHFNATIQQSFALSILADPNALSELSAEEKATIVNFLVFQ
jgi:hypothetical protein